LFQGELLPKIKQPGPDVALIAANGKVVVDESLDTYCF